MLHFTVVILQVMTRMRIDSIIVQPTNSTEDSERFHCNMESITIKFQKKELKHNVKI